MNEPLLRLLPPANEVCEGYVFTAVCHSFCSQGGTWAGAPPGAGTHLSGQVHRPPWGRYTTPPGRYTPHGQVNPLGQVHTPGQVHPPPRQVHTSPGWYTPPGQVHPQAGTAPAGIPWGRYPPSGAVHAGRYGQQAGGRHPTGMHSCLVKTITAAHHILALIDMMNHNFGIMWHAPVLKLGEGNVLTGMSVHTRGYALFQVPSGWYAWSLPIPPPLDMGPGIGTPPPPPNTYWQQPHVRSVRTVCILLECFLVGVIFLVSKVVIYQKPKQTQYQNLCYAFSR